MLCLKYPLKTFKVFGNDIWQTEAKDSFMLKILKNVRYWKSFFYISIIEGRKNRDGLEFLFHQSFLVNDNIIHTETFVSVQGQKASYYVYVNSNLCFSLLHCLKSIPLDYML